MPPTSRRRRRDRTDKSTALAKPGEGRTVSGPPSRRERSRGKEDKSEEKNLSEVEEYVPGKKYRFEARSAEEAATLIREKLGPKAYVISVEQMSGKGLARFLSSPKLEVIATIAEDSGEQPADAQSEEDDESDSDDPMARRRRKLRRVPQVKQAGEATPGGKLPERPAEEAAPQQKQAPRKPRSYASAEEKAEEAFEQRGQKGDYEESPSYRTQLTPSGTQSIKSFLRKAAFDEELLSRMEHTPRWQHLDQNNLAHGLAQMYQWLKSDYNQVEMRPLAQRTAFVGTPGSGKTSALCKKLCSDVFFQSKHVQVLKLENDTPNSDDNLRVFSDILSVPLLRDPDDLPRLPEYDDLYIDTTGINLGARDEWHQLKERLEQVYADSRVLVINANYDRDIIKQTITQGLEIGCTHLVFSHVDEMTNVTKLWQFLLHSGLTPLFVSLGQNVTSEYTDRILEYLVDRTFPSFITQPE